MPHNADDILGQVDWDEWPDFDLFGEPAETPAPEPDSSPAPAPPAP